MKWCWMTLLFAANTAVGQFYFYDDKYLDQPVLIDVGATIGVMSCLTDLGYGNKINKGLQFTGSTFRLEAGLFGEVRWNQLLGFRINFNYGQVTAADSVLKYAGDESVYRYQRNLHFRSNIFESTLSASLYLAGFNQLAGRAKLNPYLLAGVGLFHYDPQALLAGEWTSLPLLRTEGSSPATFYNRWQSNLVAGVGCSYEISAILSTSFECCYRILHTDYLDDVSTVFIDPSVGERN
ncbi:MAG TPA: hypothetical protein VLC28_04290, partial [Flavitalea sp.]|nr:hypothetical protein [Flavitalea sp.]